MKIGTDIARISRFEKLTEKDIPKRIFAKEEAVYILSKKNSAQTAAGIFAAKEAFVKAVGTGIADFPLNEIIVMHDSYGAPRIHLCSKAAKIFEKHCSGQIEVSISHDGEYAAAAVCIKTDKYFEYYKRAAAIYENCTENTITPAMIHPHLPKRRDDIHKGSCGRLYVSAGSKGLTGAAIMACTAALKCGAGLITLGCCESLNTVFEITLREVMTKPLPDSDGSLSGANAPAVSAEAEKADVCLIGPGMGRDKAIGEITEKVFDNENIYAVADADALFAASQNMNMLKNHKAKLILTPHIGEFANLTGHSTEQILSDTAAQASVFAEKYNVTLVLKSHKTVVAAPDGRCLVNISGNPGMATGGTGDVLSGAIASFAAQGMKPFDAACTGVYIHSLAADMAAAEKGEYSLTPSDIIDYLPYAIKFSTGR